METKEKQKNTAPTRKKPCQYSLSAGLKVNYQKKWTWIKNSKRSMWFFNVIANYGKQVL